MTWVKRWGYEVKATNAPGVKLLRDGRYLVHANVSDKGKKRKLSRVVAVADAREASRARLEMIDEALASQSSATQLFAGYAASLYERKVAQRELKSAKTRERWDTTLRKHLVPAFGSSRVDAITKLDVESWKTRVAKKIDSGKYSPRTANGWLSILRVIIRTAIDDLGLKLDPTIRVKDFPTEEHPTYTDEEPNALTPKQTRDFLTALKKKAPQCYAFALLGFATGLRPSTIRPLRRRGPEADVLWDQGAILVRRSNSLGHEVMNTTKTGKKYKLSLPRSVMKELEAHAKKLRGARRRSTLLFPGRTGEPLARSALDKPFAAAAKAIGLSFTFTPRGMRRTYQDLGRSLNIEKKVRKAICGHETDEMSDLYSTVHAAEMRRAVGRIAKLATPAPKKKRAA